MNDNFEREIDFGCMDRLALAVESLLLASDLPKGLESAFLSIGPLRQPDFPTAELRQMFAEIEAKHLAFSRNYNERPGAHAMNPALCHLRYATMSGPTKHWFKKQIWELFSTCLHHNLALLA